MDLLYLQDQVTRLCDKYPQYKKIAEIFSAHDYFDDDLDIPIPTRTSISRDTGIKIPKVKKQLKEIHDLIFLKDGVNLSFHKTRYRICFSDHGAHFEINLKHLPVVPRVGENLDIPFIKARFLGGLFYVEEIDHLFENGTQIIEIWCKTGRTNKYLQFRKDKAEALGEIENEEVYKLNNYDLKGIIIRKEIDK